MQLYYDKEGQPISLEKWGSYKSDMNYAMVAQWDYGDNRVSTVWMGLRDPLSFLDEAATPLIFETMTFGPNGGDTERWATKAEALAGHEFYVELVKSRIKLKEN